MMSFRSALLAAVVLAGVPTMVHAQDDRRGRPEGAGRNPDRGQQQQAAPQAQPAPAPAPQAQAQPQLDRRAPDTQARQFNQQPQAQPRGDYANRQQRDGRNDASPQAQQQRPQGDGRNPGFDRGRASGTPNLYNGRDNNRFDNNNRFNGNNGFNNGRPGYQEPRGDNRFNQNWRNDRRYDWQNYRNNNRQLFRAPRYTPPRNYGYGYRPFYRGYQLEPFFYGQNYWIDDPWEYRLPPAYGPYRWVRYYDDVLLVDITTGFVVDAIQNFFW